MLNLAHLGKSSIRGQAVASTIPRTAIGIMEVHFQLNSNSFSSSCAIFNSVIAYGADHSTFLSLPNSTTEAAGPHSFRKLTCFSGSFLVSQLFCQNQFSTAPPVACIRQGYRTAAPIWIGILGPVQCRFSLHVPQCL